MQSGESRPLPSPSAQSRRHAIPTNPPSGSAHIGASIASSRQHVTNRKARSTSSQRRRPCTHTGAESKPQVLRTRSKRFAARTSEWHCRIVAQALHSRPRRPGARGTNRYIAETLCWCGGRRAEVQAGRCDRCATTQRAIPESTAHNRPVEREPQLAQCPDNVVHCQLQPVGDGNGALVDSTIHRGRGAPA